jgi:hypothetical protein
VLGCLTNRFPRIRKHRLATPALPPLSCKITFWNNGSRAQVLAGGDADASFPMKSTASSGLSCSVWKSRMVSKMAGICGRMSWIW